MMLRRSVLILMLLVLVQALAFPVFAAADDEPGFVGTIISAVGDYIEGLGQTLLDGLKFLFIPSDDYYPRVAERLQSAFSEKFGGLVDLIRYLKDRFSNLPTYRKDLLVLQFPPDHLFGGKKVDILANSQGLATMVRGALSAFVVLSVAAYVIRQVQGMIRE